MSDTNRKGILCASPSSEDECTIVSVLESVDSIINYDLYKKSCLDIVNVYRDVILCSVKRYLDILENKCCSYPTTM